MSLRNLLTVSYWFVQPHLAQKGVYWVWVLGLLLLVAVGLGCLIALFFKLPKQWRVLCTRTSQLALTMGILGILLFALRQQNVALFGLRFWFLIWAIAFLAWAYSIGYYVFKRMPQIKIENEERLRREKYLPKSK